MDRQFHIPYVYVPQERLEDPNPLINDGEWEIKEGKILLYQRRSRCVVIEGELEGNELVDRRSGRVFMRQDISVGKKSEP